MQGFHDNARVNSVDQPLRHFDLRRADIFPASAYDPVEVGCLKLIEVNERERANAEMGELFRYERTHTTEANDADSHALQFLLTRAKGAHIAVVHTVGGN